MRRRDFVAGFAGVALAAGQAPTALAQKSGKVYRIGILVTTDQGTDHAGDLGYWRAWNEELKRLGYLEGENLLIERRTVDPERIGDLVREIERLELDAIFAPPQRIVALLKAAAVKVPTVTIPIDPVGSKLVDSLARPGGNITGFSLDAGLETIAKRIEMLREAAPKTSRMGVLIQRFFWEDRFGDVFRDAARQLGVTAIGAPLEPPAGEREYRSAFADMARNGVDSLYVTLSGANLLRRDLIAALAIGAGLPSMNSYRENVEAGGLMSYGADLADIFRRAAGYLDLILHGSDPAVMPIQAPTKFDLVVNLATARALGLEFPPGLLARADEVIE